MRIKKLSAVILSLVLAITSISYTKAAGESKAPEIKIEQTSLGQVVVQDVVKLQDSFSPSFKNYKSISSAANSARAQIVNHNSNIYAYVKSSDKNYLNVFNSLWNKIFKVTKSPIEGDYMRWDISREYLQYLRTKKTTGKKTYYYYKFTFQFYYYTTLEQRKAVDTKVKQTLKSFKFTSTTTDYTKVKTIYDYICKNVTYASGSDNIIYTSWSALYKKEAVCQGYAQLLYRFLKEEGIETRLIPGYGGSSTVNHGWNIVKIGSCYYNVDATWDAELLQSSNSYQFFLKGDKFYKHKRMEEYSTSEFYSSYPMSASLYKAGTQTLSYKTRKSIYEQKKSKITKIKNKKVTFKKVSNAYKYQIKYSTKKNFKSNVRIASTYKTTYKLRHLRKDKKYYVKVRAYGKIDNNIVKTKWSKVKNFNNE